MIPKLAPLQIGSIVPSLIGFFASFAALATPAWQVVYAREIQQWIQSGLYLNCQTRLILSLNFNVSRPSGMYTCTYTFSDSDFDFYTSAELINLRTPPFYAWQRTLLGIFLLAQLLVFLAQVCVFFSFNKNTQVLSAIGNIITLFLAVLLHTGATVAFLIFSQLVEYRFYHVSVSGIYEKHRGYSFYVEIVAIFFLFISLLLSIAHFIRLKVSSTKVQKSHDVNSSTFIGFPENHEPNFDQHYYPSNYSQYSNSRASNSLIYNPYETDFAMRALPEIPYR